MAVFAQKMHTLTTIFSLLLMASLPTALLDAHYYDKTCPQAENIILGTVYNASMHDPKVPARILRMFFHDLLLDSTPGNQAEKDGPPNISVRSFYMIDDAKTKLEMACPHTVSCADIITFAARDVVTMSRGPHWNVLALLECAEGRKDGRISKAAETINLPAPTFNVTQLIQSFAKRGIGAKDLVALSGSHTLGFSHCSSFEARLHNFSSAHDTDPSMNSEFAQKLRKKCPKPNRDHNAGEFLDSTLSTFDNDYYRRLMPGMGVFGSDQALAGDYRTRWIEFTASMVKLGNVGVIENGEVRLKCRVVN
ncbi:hypothetical protein ACB092_12G081500 [Castanea dentata]